MSWTGHSATEEQGGVKGSDQCHGLDLVLQENRVCVKGSDQCHGLDTVLQKNRGESEGL